MILVLVVSAYATNQRVTAETGGSWPTISRRSWETPRRHRNLQHVTSWRNEILVSDLGLIWIPEKPETSSTAVLLLSLRPYRAADTRLVFLWHEVLDKVRGFSRLLLQREPTSSSEIYDC